MKRLLHQSENYRSLLDYTSESQILISPNGDCIDVDPHCDLWFLQPEFLLNKNIFSILPAHCYIKLISDFQTTLSDQVITDRKFKLPLHDGLYYAQCKFIPFKDNVLCLYTDITKRENLHIELQQANDEMIEIQKVAKLGKWRLDTRSFIVNYSGYSVQKDGIKFMTLTLDDYFDKIIPEDREKVHYWLDICYKEMNRENITFRIHIQDKIEYINAKCIIRKNVRDVLILEGIVQYVSEIHKRRNDVNTLTHVVFNIKESIFGMNSDGRMKFANQIFRANHHVGMEEDITKYSIFDFHIGFINNIDLWNLRIKELENKSEIQFSDYDHPIPDKEDILAYQGYVYKVTEDDGNYSYWSFAHDISNQIRYEGEIKRFSMLIDTILNNLPASIVVKDVSNDFRYIYCNRNSMNTEFSSSTFRTLTGKNDFDLFPKEKAEKVRRQDLDIIETKKPFHQVIKIVDELGNVSYYDKSKMLISDNQFTPMILSIEWDITKQELLNQKLKSAMVKAEESDKLKTIFMANISHEIRTPLNAIVGFSNVLVDCDDMDERKNYFGVINQSTKRLMKLINDILFLSRIESGDLQLALTNVNVNGVCDEVYELMVELCPQGVQLVKDVPRDSAVVYSDMKQMIKIFCLLISNAFKYTSSGTVKYGYVLKKDYIDCFVKDTGRGIKVKNGEDVFGLFTKYNYGNGVNGLELTISHALVRLMGGTIKAKTEENKGSIFTFTLPLKYTK